MKKLLPFLFLIMAATSAMAQHTNQCGIIIPPKSFRSNFVSVYEAGGYPWRVAPLQSSLPFPGGRAKLFSDLYIYNLS